MRSSLFFPAARQAVSSGYDTHANQCRGGRFQRERADPAWWQDVVLNRRAIEATAPDRRVKRLSDVDRTASGALFDLLAATEAVGDDQCICGRPSASAQQAKLADAHRHIDMGRFKAK